MMMEVYTSFGGNAGLARNDSEPFSKMRILSIIARLNIGGPAIYAIFLSGPDMEPRYRSMLVSGQVSPGEGDMTYLAQEKGVKPVIVPELGREISPLNDFFCFIALRRII